MVSDFNWTLPETYSMYDVKIDDPEYWTLDYHKYISKSRIVRDENDVKKLVEQLRHFRAFDYHDQDLVCILDRVHQFNSNLISSRRQKRLYCISWSYIIC